MTADLAVRPVRAEPGEVEQAGLAPDVLLGAVGAEGAEAHVVVRAGREAAEGVDVQVQALVAVGAVAVAHEEVALGHLPQVVLVQELAVLALLAQAAQPVLAHERVEPARGPVGRPRELRVGDVPLGAVRAVGAVARVEGLAYGPVGEQADLVGAAEEGGEVEVVGLGVVVDDVGGRGGDGRAWGGHGGWEPRERWALTKFIVFCDVVCQSNRHTMLVGRRGGGRV